MNPGVASRSIQELCVAEVKRIAHISAGAAPCTVCASLICPGWESVRASLDHAALRCLGTLADPSDEDPTVAEHHPDGTHLWSPDAPIALRYFPFNRCQVWQCASCPRSFLRYTEYGGYYVDERIRELNVALIAE